MTLNTDLTDWLVVGAPEEVPNGSNAAMSEAVLLPAGTADAGLAGCESDPNGSDENGSVL